MHGSLFYLGEYVDRAELVAENVAAKLAAAALLGRAGLDVRVSVDPTQIGHSLDPAAARGHAFTIAEAVAQAAGNRPGVHALMLDMEDQSVTAATIALHDAMRSAGLPAALTLQAYLRRTEADLRVQIRGGARVRLVKGAFAARSGAAFTRQAEITANFRRLIELMFSREARDTGFYPIIATHDDKLHRYAMERAAANDWRAGDYEFEMPACAATLPKIWRGAASACGSICLSAGTGGPMRSAASARTRAMRGSCCARWRAPGDTPVASRVP
jgi:proline dehydrogenase